MSGVLRDGLSAGSIPPQDEREGVSRRALLGAGVGLSFETPVRQAHRLLRMSGAEAQGPLHPPSPSAAAGPPPRPGEEWEKALAALEKAEAAVREIEGATAGYALDDEEALLPAHDAACEAIAAALQRMLFVPAPDLLALGIKFEAAFDHELKNASEDDLRFRALLTDIIQLWGAEVRAGAWAEGQRAALRAGYR